MLGPDDRLRRRDGFKLTDARMTPREVLSEIHYCVSATSATRTPARRGFATRTGKVAANPLGIALERLPARREDLRDALLRKARRRASARWRIVMHRQPDVPRHRPPHLQRLHEGLHLPEAGAGQHPADRDRRAHRRARAAVGLRDLRPAHALEPAQRRAARTRCRTTARTCSSSASGPAGYTLAHYLVNEGFGVVGIDGLKIEPLPDELDRRRDGSRRAPIRDWREIYRRARRARARRLRRRLRVRHHRALGQELPDAAPPDAGAPRAACASTAACASAAR